jgi:transketolase
MTNHNLRDVYGRTLVELGKENQNIVVLEADLGKSTMTCYFEDAFPNRFFEMGIAEANMTGFAAGLSLTGKVAFTNSFAVFAAGRSYDQIRQSVCLPKLNVKIVGSSAGLSDYGDGSTHQTIEDIAIMRAIPNMTVLVPADAVETAKMTRAAAAHAGPVYLRITRSDLPDVVPENEEIVIGKPYLLRDGSDVVVYACGAMVAAALEAAEAAKAQGLSLKVVNVSSLKPIDETALKSFAKGVKAIVTAEEHSLIGGLASVVTYAFRGSALPIECVGIADKFGQSAENIDVLMEAYGLTAAEIVKAAVAAKRKATV